MKKPQKIKTPKLTLKGLESDFGMLLRMVKEAQGEIRQVNGRYDELTSRLDKLDPNVSLPTTHLPNPEALLRPVRNILWQLTCDMPEGPDGVDDLEAIEELADKIIAIAQGRAPIESAKASPADTSQR